MPTQTLTLTEFLLARIAEDEGWAESSSGHPDGGAFARDNYGILWIDPARVLARCEADRRIVERHSGKHHCPTPADEWHRYEAGERVDYEIPCGDLRDLAAVYADHPDYRPEWRP